MSSIATKFGIGDTAYTFDGNGGYIRRHIVKGIEIKSSTFDTEVMYYLSPSPAVASVSSTVSKYAQSAPEQELYNDVEVKELANVWLIDKSVSIFSYAGL
jgi:hypothetical protein